jgi:peptide/nickel transport system substrate-binding protein
MERVRRGGSFALISGFVILLLLGLGVLLAVEKGTRSPLGAAPQGRAPDVAGERSGAREQVYREGVVGAPTTINPLLAASQPDRDLSALIFSGLTRTAPDGTVLPDLARSWKIEERGRRYVFTLRDDATWHDGRPFTARDVLFTVRLVQDAAFPGDSTLADFWRTVTVETPDERTVVYTLATVYAPFLTFTDLGLLPAHLLGDVKAEDLPGAAFNLQPVGTGRFSFAGLDSPRLAVTLNRHDAYYGDKPSLAGLRFHFYPSTAAVLRGVAAGEVDGAGYLPPQYLGEAGIIADTANVYGPSLAGYTALFFNLRLPVFGEREVRQALALAIDRDALVKEGLGGWGTRGSSPILPSSWAYTEQNVPRYPFDPARARQTLERAGWRPGANGVREKGGQALGFVLLTNDDPGRAAVANLLAQQLAAIGCQVVVQAEGADEVAQRVALRRFDAALFGWEGLASDPDPYQIWHSSQAETGYNFANYANPDVDEALAQARLTTDLDQRKEYYATFQRLFATDLPSIVLYYPQYHFAVSKRVSGVGLDPLDRPSDRFRSIADWQLAPLP